jgi:hypothetical protein
VRTNLREVRQQPTITSDGSCLQRHVISCAIAYDESFLDKWFSRASRAGSQYSQEHHIFHSTTVGLMVDNGASLLQQFSYKPLLCDPIPAPASPARQRNANRGISRPFSRSDETDLPSSSLAVSISILNLFFFLSLPPDFQGRKGGCPLHEGRPRRRHICAHHGSNRRQKKKRLGSRLNLISYGRIRVRVLP